MAGGGIGVDYTLRNLPRMLPGTAVVPVFWLAGPAVGCHYP